jgi:elongation factor 1 alpha-like protein
MQLVPLHPGTVLCHPDFPLHPAARLQAKIVTLEAVRVPLLVGSTVVLHAYSLAVEAKVSALTHQLDPKTGEIFKTRWGCTAVVEYSLPIA